MDDYISRQAVKELTTCRNSIWNTITDSQGRGLDEILDSIPSSCDGCKWEETKGYAGECHHCSRAYRDYYEVEE